MSKTLEQFDPNSGSGEVTSLKFLVLSIHDQKTTQDVIDIISKTLKIKTASSKKINLADLKAKAAEFLEEYYGES